MSVSGQKILVSFIFWADSKAVKPNVSLRSIGVGVPLPGGEAAALQVCYRCRLEDRKCGGTAAGAAAASLPALPNRHRSPAPGR